MTITEERIAEALIIGLVGRMDTLAAISLEQRLNQTVDRGERKIVLYLAKLDYMSSSGLRTLLGLAKRLQSEGGKLVLSCPSEPIRELILMARLEEIIPIYASNGEAILAFPRPKARLEE